MNISSLAINIPISHFTLLKTHGDPPLIREVKYFTTVEWSKAPCFILRRVVLMFMLWLVTLVFPVEVLAADMAKSSTPKILRVTLDDNYPPYTIRETNGLLEGYLVDEWNLWESKTGVHVELIASDWAESQQTMADGRADVIDTIFRTSEREHTLDFTPPYVKIPVAIYTNSVISGVRNSAALRGFQVGVKKGDACVGKLIAAGINQLKRYPSYEALVQAAISKKIYAFCMDEPPANYLIFRAHAEQEFRKAFTLYSGEIHRAVHKGDAATLALVERGFAAITPAEQKMLHDKWMGKRLSSPLQRMQIYIMAIAASIILILAILTMLLRLLVRRRTADLLTTRNHLQATLDALPDLLFELGLDGRYYSYHSPRFGLHTVSNNVLHGKTLCDTLPFNVAQMGMSALQEAHKTGYSSGEYELETSQGIRWFEFSMARKAVEAGQEPRFIVLSRNITLRKTAEHNIERLTKLYAALSQCNQAIVRCNTEAELFPQICRDAVNFGGMVMAWIGMLDEAGQRINSVASFGVGIEYLDGINITMTADESSGRGPTGTAMRENRPVWCQDFQHNSSTSPWHERAMSFGWQASAALPLHRQGRVVGAFMLYANVTNAFDEPARNLLIEMATDISYALDNFAQEATRIEMERALHENEALLLKAQHIAHMGFLEWNLKTNEIFCSDEVYALYGIDRRETPTAPEFIMKNVHPDDIEYVQKNLDLAIQHIKKYNIDHRVMCPNGEIVWVNAQAEIACDTHGNPEVLLGSIVDITERKQVEIALYHSDQAYRATFDQAAVGIARVSADGTWLDVNQRLAEIVGYSRDELLQLTLQDITYPNDLNTDYEYRHKMMVGNIDSYSLEKRYLRKSGEIIWTNLTVALVREQDSSPKYFVLVVEDITQRRLLEEELKNSEDRYHKAFQASPDSINISRFRDGLYLDINSEFERVTGYRRDEVVGKTSAELHIWHNLADRQRMLDAINRDGFCENLEVDFNAKNGDLINGLMSAAIIHVKDEECILTIVRDITTRKKNEALLRKLSQAVEQNPNAILITDLDGSIEYVNAAFCEMTGYSVDEVIGKNPRILKSDKTPKGSHIDLWAHLTQGKEWRGEFINLRKDGKEFIVRTMIAPVRDASGQVTNYLTIQENITEKKQTEARIQQLAYFDQLTGLPNRDQLEDRFNAALSLAQRSGDTLAVMFFDLDHFKNINDTLGHSVGDELLKEVARRLKETLRDEDTLSRLGGDEFILILPGTNEGGASDVATKIINLVAQPYKIQQYELVTTVSIGIAIYPNDGVDVETLSKNADTAMYRVKQASRNNFRFFTDEMQTNAARTLQLTNALRRAQDYNELQLHYQPQVTLKNGQIIGVEALLRWEHPELGMVSPAEFIPIAEDSGQILQIGEWVLRTAVNQLRLWIDNGLPPMIIGVNLSAIQFRHENLIDMVVQILEEARLSPEFLELELTEAVAMDDPHGAIAVMDKLYEHGIRMSIDDFGTGYSSLSYLKKFKVYKLKIDQSFVSDISENSDDKAIVTAIINMASSLGMKTIAEGVETASQLAFLRLQGCNEVQGYYFSRPLPADQFESFMQDEII